MIKNLASALFGLSLICSAQAHNIKIQVLKDINSDQMVMPRSYSNCTSDGSDGRRSPPTVNMSWGINVDLIHKKTESDNQSMMLSPGESKEIELDLSRDFDVFMIDGIDMPPLSAFSIRVNNACTKIAVPTTCTEVLIGAVRYDDDGALSLVVNLYDNSGKLLDSQRL